MALKQLVCALLALFVLFDVGVSHAAPIPVPQAQDGQGDGLFPGLIGNENPRPTRPNLPPVPRPTQTRPLDIIQTLTTTRIEVPDNPILNTPGGAVPTPDNEPVTTTRDDALPVSSGPAAVPTRPVAGQFSQAVGSTTIVAVQGDGVVPVAPAQGPSRDHVPRPPPHSPSTSGDNSNGDASDAVARPNDRSDKKPTPSGKLDAGETVGVFAGTFLGCAGLIFVAWHWRNLARAVGYQQEKNKEIDEPDVFVSASNEGKTGASMINTVYPKPRPISNWIPPPLPSPRIRAGTIHAHIQAKKGATRWSLRPGEIVRPPGMFAPPPLPQHRGRPPVESPPDPGVRASTIGAWWRRSTASSSSQSDSTTSSIASKV